MQLRVREFISPKLVPVPALTRDGQGLQTDTQPLLRHSQGWMATHSSGQSGQLGRVPGDTGGPPAAGPWPVAWPTTTAAPE